MIILGTNSIKDTGYDVANSLRFNPASNDRLTRTPSTSGNESKWTWSGWAKRGTDNQDLMLFGCDEDANNETHLKFGTGGDIRLLDKVGGSTNGKINTLAKFRDLSAWYHIVAVFDKDNSTATDRMILYVNGVRISVFDGSVMPGNSSILNKTELVEIGALDGNGDMNGYICEVCFIDGQALAADSFGEFDEDSGIWKPKKVSDLTFGDQGYYLEMKQTGTSQNSSGMGADTSGNDNHFAVNGLTAIDQSTDTCTNNSATMSPIDFAGSAPTLSNGNLTVATASANRPIRATMGFSKGKWYAEYRFEASDNDNHIGCHSLEHSLSTTYLGGNLHSWGLLTSSGNKRNNAESTSYGSAIGYSNSIVMIAIDKDNGKIWWGKDGTWFASGDPANGTNEAFSNINTVVGADGFVTFADVTYRNGSWNFGSPSFTISSGNTDGNGYGNFEYAVPSGYYALNTKNLAEYG